MLDVYALGDDEATPEEPVEARFIGGLTLEDFRAMECFVGHCREEGLPFDYFEDARVSSGQVRKMLDLANECRTRERTRSSEEAYLRLTGILEKAAARNTGMMTFGD